MTHVIGSRTPEAQKTNTRVNYAIQLVFYQVTIFAAHDEVNVTIFTCNFKT